MSTSQQTPIPHCSEASSACFTEALFEAIHILEEHRQAGLLRKQTGDWFEQFQARVQQLMQRQSVASVPYSTMHFSDEVRSANSQDWYDRALQEMLKAEPPLQSGDEVYLS
ncbi:hypothetical protein D3C76_382580 [compost metagenome]|jgi:hypothetical protein|uniref:hypothetical protein n=1 Tax=Pseudomonas chlororaphis TaxID=587753 RepID=UPI000F98CC42|nr:hypothetical protein [Pseudomonas chlororaphis]QHC91626.1 hypothetical protein PchlR47_26090 [Pseudomonas chlororaphis]